jgi:FolB domain-containing protein
MDKIFLKKLLVKGIIGINDDEREQPQEIIISLELFTDLSKAGQNDDVQYSLNYSTLAKQVVAYVESSSRFTVEALAEDIATLCFEYPNVNRVTVRVEKPAAARFAEAVGVEIDRSRSY